MLPALPPSLLSPAWKPKHGNHSNCLQSTGCKRPLHHKYRFMNGTCHLSKIHRQPVKEGQTLTGWPGQ